MTLPQRLLLKTGRPLLKMLFRWKAEGRENIPPTGPVVLVANHVHVLDPILIQFSCPRWITFMAKEELFRSRFLGFWVRWAGAFPVRRGGHIGEKRRILDRARNTLEGGGVLGMFPEGRRNHDGRMGRGRPGSAVIASKADARVLPVGITGTDKLGGIGWLWRRPSILINIGKPFKLPASTGRMNRSQIQSLTALLMQEIAALLPPEYRGDYGGDENRES